MLPLESKEWLKLGVHFNNRRDVPARLAQWLVSKDAKKRRKLWRDISEQILHQFTITDMAYAVVPYAVNRMKKLTFNERLEILVEVGLIHSAHVTRRTTKFYRQLSKDYKYAIQLALQSAIDCLASKTTPNDFLHLTSIICALSGHAPLAELLFNLDCLNADCPSCGECVEPDDLGRLRKLKYI